MGSPTAIPGDRLFVTAPEAARILRCDHRTVLRMLESQEMPGLKTGRVWRIPAAWVREQAGISAHDAAATG